MKKSDPEQEKTTQVSLASYRSVTGSDRERFSATLLHQVINSLFLPESWNKEHRDKCIQAAMETLAEIAPKDGLGAVGSGAPKGNQNALKHGMYTRDNLELNRHINDLMRDSKKLLEEIS